MFHPEKRSIEEAYAEAVRQDPNVARRMAFLGSVPVDQWDRVIDRTGLHKSAQVVDIAVDNPFMHPKPQLGPADQHTRNPNLN